MRKRRGSRRILEHSSGPGLAGRRREARALLISYTKALPVRVAAGSPLLGAMPRLWPLPGHTPEPVEAAGGWTGSAARLEWSECTDALQAGYQVRVCAGPDFSTEDEWVAGNVPAGGERSLETLAGLKRPGQVASYRVYVLLKTGNERGSTTVTVTRPVEI